MTVYEGLWPYIKFMMNSTIFKAIWLIFSRIIIILAALLVYFFFFTPTVFCEGVEGTFPVLHE
jgi:hypothetical protein